MILTAIKLNKPLTQVEVGVCYNNKFYKGACLRHKLLLNDNIEITAVCVLGHVKGLLRTHLGIEYIKVNKVYKQKYFDYNLISDYKLNIRNNFCSI